MRSNGAVHIGNDTFLAATRDATDRLLLFSSDFAAEEQIADLPLDRRAHFNPHAALPCSPAELERHIAAAARTAAAGAGNGDQQRKPQSPAGKSGGEFTSTDAASPLFRHALYPSSTGTQVAAISNLLRHHYIVDITTEPAAVCALEMPEIVRSVCWHPVLPCILYVLFVSGDMAVFDTSRSRIGVVLPRHRRVALRPVIQRCLLEVEEANHVSSSSSSPSAATTTKAAGKEAPATRPVSNAKQVTPTSTAAKSFTSPSVYHSTAQNATVPVYTVHTMSSPTTGTVSTASHLATSPQKAMAERQAFDEVIPIDKEPGEASVAVVSAEVDGDASAQRPTAQTDLVDIFALPPTPSIPVILLVLSSGGDVYAVHLSEADTLPVLATADAVDDGRVRTAAEEKQRRAAAETASTVVNAEVHHVIKGALADTTDEALAVRGHLVDAAAGTHAVFYCTAHGSVCGAWVGEPDLLARHRTAGSGGGGGPSFTVRLDGAAGGVRECLSPAVPTTTHAATMTVHGNLCLLRLGESGEATYLLSLPCWDRVRKGWSVWQPTCAEPQTTAELRGALPLLSLKAAVPPPVALRLPYDTRGLSVALGDTELVLVPEVVDAAPDTRGRRRRILSITLLSLLRSALYARCGPLQLHPAVGPAPAPGPPTAGGAAARMGLVMPAPLHSSDAASGRAALQRLVNLIPPCHRAWLCAAPQADVDAATVDVVTQVETQEREVAQRERVQAQRREKLMARVALLEGRMSELTCTLDKWQQTLLDAIVHRRGAAAVRTANERLGEVYMLLNEWEQQQEQEQ